MNETENRIAFSQEVIDFIANNERADPFSIALKKSPFPETDMKTIARQIQGRQVARKKFPFLLRYEQYRYPVKESLEQASSEDTAIFKARLIQGKTFVDLTGGMGIDTYLLGRSFEKCTYVEPINKLCSETSFNFKQIGFDHCASFNITCEEFLEQNTQRYDWAYIDPSRRIDGSRKISISNYEPNIVELQQKLNEVAENVLIKLSPMQDISECVRMLQNVQAIWVVSVRNEVKELLLHLRSAECSSPVLSAVDLDKKGEREFSCLFEERESTIGLHSMNTYLYQPGAAIIKAQLQDKYAFQQQLKKLHPNTQLYTSDTLMPEFMGRVFLVKETISLNKKELKKALPEMKANVITKNFPLNPQQLIKKFKLKEGGDIFLIAYSDFKGQKLVSICMKVF